MARWVAARCKGPGKHPGGTGQGVPQQQGAQVEAHESLDGREVPVEPCGLELDWWLETWRRTEERKFKVQTTPSLSSPQEKYEILDRRMKPK